MAQAGSHTDISACTIGSTTITGIVSISYGGTTNIVMPTIADGESHQGTPYLGSEGGYNGTITFSSIELAKAAERLEGTLGATIQGFGGATDKTLAITGVVTGTAQVNVPKDGASTASLPFMYGSADGTTDPVDLS